MSTILHVTHTGHRCYNPLGGRAKNIQAGERLQLGRWELWAVKKGSHWIYCVEPVQEHTINQDYEFSNFNCAAAKLAELGTK